MFCIQLHAARRREPPPIGGSLAHYWPNVLLPVYEVRWTPAVVIQVKRLSQLLPSAPQGHISLSLSPLCPVPVHGSTESRVLQ